MVVSLLGVVYSKQDKLFPFRLQIEPQSSQSLQKPKSPDEIKKKMEARQSTSPENRPSFSSYWRKTKKDTSVKSLTFVQSDPSQSTKQCMFPREPLFPLQEMPAPFLFIHRTKKHRCSLTALTNVLLALGLLPWLGLGAVAALFV